MTEAKEKTVAARKPKAKAIAKFLKSEGYRPEIDSDGNITFKREGRLYWIITYEDDADYIAVQNPLIRNFTDESEREHVYWAMNEVQLNYKMLCMTMSEDNWVSAEIYILANPFENFSNVLPRAINVLGIAREKFNEYFEKKRSETSS